MQQKIAKNQEFDRLENFGDEVQFGRILSLANASAFSRDVI